MPTGARAFWKGYLRLSLVSISVEIYAGAVSAETTSLHQIHKPSGKRVRYEKVVPGVGPIDSDDIVKGFEIAPDSYVVLEPEELDAIKLESSRAIDFVQFVDPSEIDPRYYDKPYYVAPEGDVSTEALIVLREALRAANKTGLAKMTMRGRENLVAIMPFGDGLLLETLRYAKELRAPAPYFENIHAKIDQELVALAIELIKRKTRKFEPNEYRDAYAEALEQLVARKSAGHAIIKTADEDRRPPGKVVNLIEALRQSVGAERERRKRPPEKPPRREPRAPASKPPRARRKRG